MEIAGIEYYKKEEVDVPIFHYLLCLYIDNEVVWALPNLFGSGIRSLDPVVTRIKNRYFLKDLGEVQYW